MKTRKLISLFLCVALMLSLSINYAYAGDIGVNDEQKTVAQQQKDFNETVDLLQKYLELNADGTISLNAPSNIITSVDKNIFAQLQAGIEQTNEMIKIGYLVCDKNFNMTVTQKYNDDVVSASPNTTVTVSKNSIAVTTRSAGVTKVDWYWWGFFLYMDHQLTQAVANGSQFTATIMALFGSQSRIGKLVCASLAALAYILKTFDQGNGVYIKYNYYYVAGIPSIVSTGIWSQ